MTSYNMLQEPSEYQAYSEGYQEGWIDAVDEFLKELFCMKNFNDWSEIQKIAKQMKEQNK